MLPYIDIRFLHLHLGSLHLEQIPTFGLMLWLAAVVAGIVMDRNFRRAHLTADAVGMVAVAVVAGIVGAKLWHVLDTPMEFREYGWSVLWDSAGFAWFGGLVFGISALLIQGWVARIGALRTLDLAAPAAAIGYGIGRIGCFLSGDGCYGLPIQPVHLLGLTFRPWGMSFPNGLEPVFVPVYPTPLYELAAGLLIGAWLWRQSGAPADRSSSVGSRAGAPADRSSSVGSRAGAPADRSSSVGWKPHATGAILGQYLLLTGLARFLVEFIRRNPKILWDLSNAQLASAGSILAGIALIAWVSTRPVPAPAKAAVPAAKAA